LLNRKYQQFPATAPTTWWSDLCKCTKSFTK